MPQLIQTESGLVLTDGINTLAVDFSQMVKRISPHALNRELIVRAAKLKGNSNPLVLDATAGLAEDSFLLAAAGHRVMLFEQDEIIASLLKDGLQRAFEIPELSDVVARMELTVGDSIEAMRNLVSPVDIIYLDPMFPKRTKSALVKKKFQLLQQLEMPCANEEELLNAAISANPKRILIKRPVKGPYLANHKPSYSITGKSVRYDCI